MTPRVHWDKTPITLEQIEHEIKALHLAFSTINTERSYSSSETDLEDRKPKPPISRLCLNLKKYHSLNDAEHTLIESAFDKYLRTLENSSDNPTWHPHKEELKYICFLSPTLALPAATNFIWLGRHHINTSKNRRLAMEDAIDTARILPQLEINQRYPYSNTSLTQLIFMGVIEQIKKKQTLYRLKTPYPSNSEPQPKPEQKRHFMNIKRTSLLAIKNLFKKTSTTELSRSLKKHVYEPFAELNTTLLTRLLENKTREISLHITQLFDLLKILFALQDTFENHYELLSPSQLSASRPTPKIPTKEADYHQQVVNLFQELFAREYLTNLRKLWTEGQLTVLNVESLLQTPITQIHDVLQALTILTPHRQINWIPTLEDHLIIREAINQQDDDLINITLGLKWLGQFGISKAETRHYAFQMTDVIHTLMTLELVPAKDFPLSFELKEALFLHLLHSIRALSAQPSSAKHRLFTRTSASLTLVPHLSASPPLSPSPGPEADQKESSTPCCCLQ